MFGFHINKLTLSKQKTNNPNFRETLWLEEGQQGQDWRETSRDVTLNTGDQLLFTAYRGRAYSGDIAIDTISVTSGSCA